MKRFDWVLLTAVVALTAVGALVQIRMANLPGNGNELLPLIAGLAAGIVESVKTEEKPAAPAASSAAAAKN